MKVDALGGKKKQTIDKMDNGKWDNVQEIVRFFQLSTAKSVTVTISIVPSRYDPKSDSGSANKRKGAVVYNQVSSLPKRY